MGVCYLDERDDDNQEKKKNNSSKSSNTDKVNLTEPKRNSQTKERNNQKNADNSNEKNIYSSFKPKSSTATDSIDPSSSYKPQELKPSQVKTQEKMQQKIQQQMQQQFQLNEEELKNFREKMVELINEKREKHKANIVELNDDMNKIAQAHAEKLAKKGKVEYSNNKYHDQEISEIIFKSMQTFNESICVNYWYSDRDQYNEKNPKESNFTKLVWKISMFVGIGVARDADKKYYCVCNLLPSGGEFNENVNVGNQVYLYGPGETDKGDDQPSINKNRDPQII